MIFRNRPDPPECLTETTRHHKKHGLVENQIAWGLNYAERKRKKLNCEFKWATYNGEKLNNLLESTLRLLTQNHCAFCDIFPLLQSGRTIEHFKPKSVYPEASHLWINLFYCCNACQITKMERFHESLLKPDQVEYSFNKYFVCQINDAAIFILPNPRASNEDRLRAETTINIYGFNNLQRPEARYTVLMQFNDSNNPEIDNFSYRFLFS